MNRANAEAFAKQWIDAWNRRDLEAVLAHYAEAIVFHSPRIATVLGESTPSVAGKTELRQYWARALELSPELHFELKSILLGSDALTILYRNHRAEDVAETLLFERSGELVILGIATYR